MNYKSGPFLYTLQHLVTALYPRLTPKEIPTRKRVATLTKRKNIALIPLLERVEHTQLKHLSSQNTLLHRKPQLRQLPKVLLYFLFTKLSTKASLTMAHKFTTLPFFPLSRKQLRNAPEQQPRNQRRQVKVSLR